MVDTYLLIHGACHGAWCWEEVAGLLRSAGHTVVAPDLPSDDVTAGQREYAAVATTALDLAPPSGRLVVVGHSLGALTAPAVAIDRNADRLVLLAGIIGAPGLSLEELTDVDADRDGRLGDGDLDLDVEGRFRFTRTGAMRVLFHDCPTDKAEAAIAQLRFQRSQWTERAAFDSWPDCPIVSIVCQEDRVVNPDWSRRVSRERLGVEPVELPGGHSPFLSRPRALASLLMSI